MQRKEIDKRKRQRKDTKNNGTVKEQNTEKRRKAADSLENMKQATTQQNLLRKTHVVLNVNRSNCLINRVTKQ